MKILSYFPLFAAFSATILADDAIDNDRAANTVILDEIGVKNLRIEMVPVSEETFESTVFAIGRIEEIPATRSALSSRIAGRIVELNAYIGDEVKAGQVLAKVESRQPGNPPPTIELRALQGGTVVDSHSRIGEPVEPDADLLDISDRTKLWAVAKIPEPEASGIVPGTKARIRVPALGDEVIEAKLARFGVEANREAGTIEGIFEIDNSNGRLQPGMRAEFSLITGVRKDVMSVPRSAVQGDPTKRVVFVEDFELPNAFVKAPVVLGEQNDTHVEVISGLFPRRRSRHARILFAQLRGKRKRHVTQRSTRCRSWSRAQRRRIGNDRCPEGRERCHQARREPSRREHSPVGMARSRLGRNRHNHYADPRAISPEEKTNDLTIHYSFTSSLLSFFLHAQRTHTILPWLSARSFSLAQQLSWDSGQRRSRSCLSRSCPT